MARLLRSALLVLAALIVACGDGEPQAPAPTFTPPPPTALIPSAQPADEIELPDGFSAFVIADEFVNPTSVAVAPDGAVYVSQFGGPVFRLTDLNRDGLIDMRVRFVPIGFFINGIAFSPDGTLYVSSQGMVSAFPDADGDTVADDVEQLITDLPNGAHQNNGLAFGRDGKLYITNGSTCNECEEADERSATILQANPDGSELRVYARGLRNSYDLALDGRGRLWATDNGSDPPCNTLDELNLIEDGGDYGWPYSPDCDSLESGTPPDVSLGFNTGSTGIDWYDGQHFPEEYREGFYITLWGSNANAPQPAGRVLVFVAFDEEGNPRETFEEFGTGFENPIDVVMDADGTLLVLDFVAGKLYRIVYTGG